MKNITVKTQETEKIIGTETPEGNAFQKIQCFNNLDLLKRLLVKKGLIPTKIVLHRDRFNRIIVRLNIFYTNRVRQRLVSRYVRRHKKKIRKYTVKAAKYLKFYNKYTYKRTRKYLYWKNKVHKDFYLMENIKKSSRRLRKKVRVKQKIKNSNLRKIIFPPKRSKSKNRKTKLMKGNNRKRVTTRKKKVRMYSSFTTMMPFYISIQKINRKIIYKKKKVYRRRKYKKFKSEKKFMNYLKYKRYNWYKFRKKKNKKKVKLILNDKRVLSNIKVFKKYRRIFFERTPFIFSDFMEILEYIAIGEVHPQILLNIVGRVFRTAHRKKHGKFREFMKDLMEYLLVDNKNLVYKSRILGIKFVLSGRINAKQRSSVLKLKFGIVAPGAASANNCTSQTHIYNPYGCFGLKLIVNYSKL